MEISQIPYSVEDCIYLMRSYVYIDKLNAKVYIRDVSTYLAPGFVLGLCAQIPFLDELVEPYIYDVYQGILNETEASDLHYEEMKENEYYNDQLVFYPYTNVDWNLILSSLLVTIVRCVYKNNEDRSYHKCIDILAKMVDMEPIVLLLPNDFHLIMQMAFHSTPELLYRLMFSIFRIDDHLGNATWSLIKRFVSMEVDNYQLDIFFAIGDWYEARIKTLAHADSQIRKEMKLYKDVLIEMKAIVDDKHRLGAFRILNSESTLPYLRQFPLSAHCAVEWKKKTDRKWSNCAYKDRFGVDTEAIGKLLEIPIKFTSKRPLKDDEFEKIACKKLKYAL